MCRVDEGVVNESPLFGAAPERVREARAQLRVFRKAVAAVMRGPPAIAVNDLYRRETATANATQATSDRRATARARASGPVQASIERAGCIRLVVNEIEARLRSARSDTTPPRDA